MVGNALLTCDPAQMTNCAAVQQGTEHADNGGEQMVFIDVDAGAIQADFPAAPANSSMATLALPSDPSMQVLFAGLYWGGRADQTDPNRASIYIKGPGAPSYQQLTALSADLHTYTGSSTWSPDYPYTGFVDVTSQVQGAGGGDYYVGGLTAATGNGGSLGHYGGWALIVVYQDNTSPYRRLMVFDGDIGYITSGQNQTTTIGNLLTPPTGEFDAYLGALVWEGDESISGDAFEVSGAGIANPGALSDAENAANNFWNSKITRLGSLFTAKNPDYVNQFAVDLKLVDISNTAANAGSPHVINSTYTPGPPPSVTPLSLDATFTTSQDAYFPHALVFVSDLFHPEVIPTLTKTAQKVAGSPGPYLHLGDTIRYTISFRNDGLDGAIRVHVTDPVPVGLTYVPGSMEIVQDDGDPTHQGPQSDAQDGDFTEFMAAEGPNGTLHFRVGSGATDGNAVPPEGGLLEPGERVTLIYDTTIDSGFTGGTITNVVTIEHGSQTFPSDPNQEVSDSVDSDVEVYLAEDQTIHKSDATLLVDADGSGTVTLGDTLQYSVTVTNVGTLPLTNVVVSDPQLTPSSTTCPTLPAGNTCVLTRDAPCRRGRGGCRRGGEHGCDHQRRDSRPDLVQRSACAGRPHLGPRHSEARDFGRPVRSGQHHRLPDCRRQSQRNRNPAQRHDHRPGHQRHAWHLHAGPASRACAG